MSDITTIGLYSGIVSRLGDRGDGATPDTANQGTTIISSRKHYKCLDVSGFLKQAHVVSHNAFIMTDKVA